MVHFKLSLHYHHCYIAGLLGIQEPDKRWSASRSRRVCQEHDVLVRRFLLSRQRTSTSVGGQSIKLW